MPSSSSSRPPPTAPLPPPRLQIPPLPDTPTTQDEQHTGNTQLLRTQHAANAAAAPQPQNMLREMHQKYASDFGNDVNRRSPFEFWPREALIDVLVLHNIELRHEVELEHDHLVRICNRYFANKPLPPLPPPWPLEVQEAAEAAVLVIQQRWILHVSARRQRQMYLRQASDRNLTEEGILSPPGAASARARRGTPTTASFPPTSTAARHELEMPWYPPDMELAKEYTDYNHPRVGGPGGPPFPLKKTTLGRYCMLGGCGEQLDLWDEGQLSELSMYGSGVSNFFKMEKWAAWTFLCLFVIYSPLLILNAFGSAVGDIAESEPVRVGGLTGGFSDVAATTLGNMMKLLKLRPARTVVLPICDQFFPYDVLSASSSPSSDPSPCTLSEANVALLYTYIDIAGCIFLYIAFLWMKTFQKWEARHLERHTVTASDFTVKVTNLPDKVTETDLKVHFARALNLPVAEVALGYDNAQEIEQHKLRGVLMKQRNFVVNRCRYIHQRLRQQEGREEAARQQRGGGGGTGQRWSGRLDGVQKRLLVQELQFRKKTNEDLLKRIAKLDTKIGLAHLEAAPLCAFVTFHTQEDYMDALYAYDFSLVRYLCMAKDMRLKGHRLRVEPAPEPSLILWENLQFGKLNRWKRKLFTTFVAGSSMAISIIFVFVAKHFQDRNQERVTAAAAAAAAAGNGGGGGGGGSVGGLSREDMKAQAWATFFTILASSSVVFINYCIQLWLERMTEYEKAHSLDKQQLEMSLQVFILKFINTGGVMLLLNSKEVQDVRDVIFGSRGEGSHGNFTEKWYSTTGISLILVMLMNVVSPLAPGVYMYYLKCRAKAKAAKGKLTGFMTQDEANAIFMGPEFRLSVRYAAILMALFICFIYSAAMPILLLIGAVTFFAGYWVDKFLFLRYYRVPPQYGRELSRGVANTIQVALLLHILTSIWAFSQDTLFNKDVRDTSWLGRGMDAFTLPWVHESIRHYILKPNIVPLIVLFLTLVSLLAFRQVMNGIYNTIRTLLHLLTCWKPRTRHEAHDGCCSVCSCQRGCMHMCFPEHALMLGRLNCIDVSYPRAVERGLIKGLHSYNILQNPRYKQAFAISDRFAELHRHVESIRGHLALPFEDEEEQEGEEEEEEEGGEGGGENGVGRVVDVEGGQGILVVSPIASAPPEAIVVRGGRSPC